MSAHWVHRSLKRLLSGLFSCHIKYFRDFVYIAIPKTGSTTIRNFCGYKYWWEPWAHETAPEIIERIGPQSWEKKFTFTFVRNPYARAVSMYFWSSTGLVCDSRIHFREWARFCFSAELYPHRSLLSVRNHPSQQVQYIANNEGEILVDFVGKLENIEEDMGVVCKRLNIPFTHVPHENKGLASLDYRDYYDDETVEVVGNWFREDLEQFGYDFDGLIAPPL